MAVELLFQGHGSLRFQADAGTVVYVDPFAGEPESHALPADTLAL